jgi:choline dehydrogenase
LRGDEIFPGEQVQTNADLDAVLSSHINTQWHLSGTARMGSGQDMGAVVDSVGRVHGMKALRVVDASIMPFVTNGNTNAPTIMIAEKLSDAILGKSPLPRNDAGVWKNEHFEMLQR